MACKKILGLRSLKTAVAVAICLAISLLSGLDTEFYAAIVAVVCMQRTSKATLSAGLSRIVGMLLGGGAGFLALLCAARFPEAYRKWAVGLVVPLMLLGLLYLCELLGQTDAAGLAVVVFLGFACNFGMTAAEILPFTLQRVAQTVVGIVVAMGVNRWFFPGASARQIAQAEEEEKQAERRRRAEENRRKKEKRKAGARR